MKTGFLRFFFWRFIEVKLTIVTTWSYLSSWPMTGLLSRLIRQVTLFNNKLFTLPEQLSSLQVSNRVRVVQCLVFCVMFYEPLFVIFCCPTYYFIWFPFKTVERINILAMRINISKQTNPKDKYKSMTRGFHVL